MEYRKTPLAMDRVNYCSCLYQGR